MNKVPHKCNGCGADGDGSLRTWQTPPHPVTKKRKTRTAIDPPAGWGIRYVGTVKLNFCGAEQGNCRERLSRGHLRLVGTEVIDKQAEKQAAKAARREAVAAKKEAS